MTTRVYKELPKAYTTYPKIIKSMLPIVGKANKGSKDTLPVATYSVNKFKLDKLNLKDYRRICGFVDDGLVPPTYFAVLSQTLQMNMMVNEPFAFPMLGLVHIENSVTQYRHIADTETISMSVSFANLADHVKGKQFDFVTKVHSGEELVWEGTSTYLSRQKSSKLSPATAKRSKAKSTAFNGKEEDSVLNYVFEVPESIGRSYAKVSGDFNLIHLHPLTAKAFGFPKAIAHGMWSKAKCLSLIELPEAFKVDVQFKLPILLPAEVKLISSNMAKLENEAAFTLVNAKKDKPHLLGKISKI